MKKIFVSQRQDTIESYQETRDSLDIRWIELLYAIGCMPIILPNNISVARVIIESIKGDGILLTGGVNPVEYGGNSPERDKVDEFLIDYCINNKLPLLGVCRGMQSIVTYFGGHLVRIKDHIATKHMIMGIETRYVNSYHSFGIDCLPQCLDELGATTDRSIEYIEHKEFDIKGIMWHPERNSPFNQKDIDLLTKHFRGGNR